MYYLFVFADNSVKMVHDNLSAIDVMAASSGMLRIIRIDKGKPPVILSFLEELMTWDEIAEATVVQGAAGRIHQ